MATDGGLEPGPRGGRDWSAMPGFIAFLPRGFCAAPGWLAGWIQRCLLLLRMLMFVSAQASQQTLQTANQQPQPAAAPAVPPRIAGHFLPT